MDSYIKKIVNLVLVLAFFSFLLSWSYLNRGLSTDSRNSSLSAESEQPPDNYGSLTEKELLVLAYDGDMNAAYNLGLLYDYGLMDTAQNFERARQWYEIADAAGVPKAALSLGYLYLNGCGVDADSGYARSYFRRAIDGGEQEGYAGIGRIYLEKLRHTKDPKKISSYQKKAFDNISKAKDSGDPDGIYLYGYLKETGTGTKRDYEAAASCYQQVTETADASDISNKYALNNSYTRLGILYLEGHGTDKDLNMARTCLNNAAEDGYAMAEYYMGVIYDKGYGVSADYSEALRWFELAAQKDYAPALNQIGYMYFMGNGVPADYSQAVYYQKLSAALGYAKAQVNLGYLYENGYGVERNLKTALSYYRMAQDSNYEGTDEAIMRVEKLISKNKKR